MEENQNPNSDQFSFAEDGKKKKGMGPWKGLLIAIVIVFLICVIGLLIRMVISGDGDYFKPFKSLFGIEEEVEDKDKNEDQSKVDSSKTSTSNKSLSSPRYSLLSSDVDDKDVKHYRLTVNVKDFMEKIMNQLSSINSSSSLYGDESDYYDEDDNDNDNMIDDEDSSSYDDIFNNLNSPLSYNNKDNVFNKLAYDNEYNLFNDNEDDVLNDEDEYYNDNEDGMIDDEDEYSYDNEEDSVLDEDNGNSFLESLQPFMFISSMMNDIIDGEMYVDIYFNGNEIVQVVLGYDYEELAENLYDIILEQDSDSITEMEEEGIENVDDFVNYIKEQLDENIDEDALYDMLIEDEDIEKALKEMEIKEKDIKDVIEINNDIGLIELYLNGTKKVNDLISSYLNSGELSEMIDSASEETGFEFDKDNIIESFIEFSNEAQELEEYQDMGIEFVEIK